MRPTFETLLYFAWVVGCSVGVPSSEDADRIEAITRNNACVADLDRWHRRYEFATEPNRINRNLIDITYLEPRGDARPAGREYGKPTVMLRHGQQRIAGGLFDRTSGRLIEWHCGCLMGPESSDGPTECPADRERPVAEAASSAPTTSVLQPARRP